MDFLNLLTLLYKRYPSKWRYFVWLVLTVRMLIPFNITLPQIAFSIPVPETVVPTTFLSSKIGDAETNALPYEKQESFVPVQREPITELLPTDADSAASKEIFQLSEQYNTLPFYLIISRIWFSGMLIFMSIHICVYIRLLRKLHYSPQQETSQNIKDMLWKIGKDLGLARLPEVRVRTTLPSPVLTGIFRLVLHLSHLEYSECELAFIFKHELVHYRRHDLWYKLVLIIARDIHWFNPLVWLMSAQADRDVELVWRKPLPT